MGIKNDVFPHNFLLKCNRRGHSKREVLEIYNTN